MIFDEKMDNFYNEKKSLNHNNFQQKSTKPSQFDDFFFFDEKCTIFKVEKIRQITTLSSKIGQNHRNLTTFFQKKKKIGQFKKKKKKSSNYNICQQNRAKPSQFDKFFCKLFSKLVNYKCRGFFDYFRVQVDGCPSWQGRAEVLKAPPRPLDLPDTIFI